MERSTSLTGLQDQKKLRYVIYVAMFCTIQLVLMFIPFLGFIPIGPIAATTLHLPVITAGVLLGKKAGITLGFLFGLISMTRATLTPGIASFLFSPFAPAVGGYSGNLFSLVIAFVPRILLGWASAVLYEKFKEWKTTEKVAPGLAALLATLLHTILVLVGVALFFGEAGYARVFGIEGSWIYFIMTVVFTNGIVEAVLAVFVVTALTKVLQQVVKLDD